MSKQLNLGELIAFLEQQDPNMICARGFGRPHSYRGYYEQLAFAPEANVSVKRMLALANQALGSTYSGWKGGDYMMHAATLVWYSESGATGAEITLALLESMIAGTAGDPTLVRLMQCIEGSLEELGDYIERFNALGGKINLRVHQNNGTGFDLFEITGEFEASYYQVVKMVPKESK